MSARGFMLLVENDRNEVDVAMRAIDRAGIEVDIEVAGDGVEALEALGLEPESRATTTPSVVFLDLKMPRIDGWEVLRRMRENPRTAAIPVVVLSSSGNRDDIRRSYDLGANSFVVKKYDRRGPGTYVAEAVRYWVETNVAQ